MEEKVNYLYVLNYNVCRILEIKVSEEINENNITDILDHYNLKESECSYMWSANKLDLVRPTFCSKEHLCANFAPCICDELCDFVNKKNKK